MYAALSSRQWVLTGSLSWDIESPYLYLFDDFEGAMWDLIDFMVHW